MYQKPKFIVQHSRDCTKHILLYFCFILPISVVVLCLSLSAFPFSAFCGMEWLSCYHITGFTLSLPLKHNEHQKRSLRHKEKPRGEHPSILGGGYEGSPQQLRIMKHWGKDTTCMWKCRLKIICSHFVKKYFRSYFCFCLLFEIMAFTFSESLLFDLPELHIVTNKVEIKHELTEPMIYT